MNAQSKGGALLTEMESHVEAAEAAKAARSGSVERKIARQASALAEMLAEMDVEDEVRENLATLADRFGAVAGEQVDFTEGNGVAEKVAALIAVGEDYQPTGFDTERAEALIERWKAATGRRSRGTGESTVPESQKPPCPIKVTFTYPEGAEIKLAKEITHGSSWSSVSNEISKRAQIIDGRETNSGYKRPESAKAQWQEATKSIKEGGDGGIVEVPTEHGVMVAEVRPVRAAA